MEIGKKYFSIRDNYITEDEKYLDKKRKKLVLLINPIWIGLMVVSFIFYYFYKFTPQAEEQVEFILSLVLNISIAESFLVLMIRRIGFMDKTNWNDKKTNEKNKLFFKGKMNKESGEVAVGSLNSVIIKSIFNYYILGNMLALLIIAKTGKEKSIGFLISSDSLLWIEIGVIVVILIGILLLQSFRDFFFKKTFGLIVDDLEIGNIDAAKACIKKSLKGRTIWSESYLIAFKEIEDVIEILERKGREADEKTKERIELITNASHDIKTPLTSIISYSKILQDSNLTKEEVDEYRGILINKSKRLSKLMNELKEASEEENENINLKIEVVKIEEVICNSIDNNKDKFNERNLVVIVNRLQEELECSIDLLKTERVIQNLISNAYKYAKENSEVSISIGEKDGMVFVSFENQLEKEITETTENLLKRFTRGDKSRNTEGHGLGLNIAKRFMEDQGGYLRLEILGEIFKVTLMFKS